EFKRIDAELTEINSFHESLQTELSAISKNNNNDQQQQPQQQQPQPQQQQQQTEQGLTSECVETPGSSAEVEAHRGCLPMFQAKRQQVLSADETGSSLRAPRQRM
ncbi:unnamed protein product, partial [Polarella glacialis]